MTNSNYTAISVLLDRSGSMAKIKSDAEGGLQALIDEQRALPGRVTLRLAQFDTIYDVVHQSKPLDQIPPVVLNPRGMTALHDAWGRSMIEFGDELAALPEDQRPGIILFIVVTDGLENASIEWYREQVFDKVTEQTEKWGWKFLYVAANQDAIEKGEDLGVPRAQSVTYAHDSHGTQAAFTATSAAVTRARVSGQSVGYTDEEREAANPS
jgi:hypothetical protein